ncbi:Ies6p [Sugiyamaella lignohabitans]|uniref:Ies6p n=1 Tax=Sugiyamaella lignohabitans TaxID=796027 RepID=A0A167CRJ9_9ASCO|nr:Ies6p [Sugiyamaella lignohabitans]ANB12023.1 Ies6p [Sugiyamaella lignohabitans]
MSSASESPSLIEQADFSTVPKPFKSESWKQSNKRYKNLKALVTDEQKRLASLPPSDDKATYFSIEAPPSLRPQKHWCDITGLPGRYKSARHGLRFYNVEIFKAIDEMAPGADQQYLSLRNANVILR